MTNCLSHNAVWVRSFLIETSKFIWAVVVRINLRYIKLCDLPKALYVGKIVATDLRLRVYAPVIKRLKTC